MAIVIKPITVEVSKPNVFQAIAAKQNDSNSRFLKVTFVNEGEKISVTPLAKVTINAKRNDGQSNSFFGVVNDDGTATVPVHSWILELPGYVSCDVSIIETDGKLTSTTFSLLVEEASNTSGDISEDEPNNSPNGTTDSKYFDIDANGVLSLKAQYRGNPEKNTYPNSISDMGFGNNGSEIYKLPKIIILPENINGVAIKSLADGMFYGNSVVEEIAFPNTITVIPTYFCRDTKSLKTIKNTEHITTIGASAFMNSRLEEALFPNLAEAGNQVFTQTPYLRTAHIGKLQTIPLGFFASSQKLSTVKGGESVKQIGDSAFETTYNLIDIPFLSQLKVVTFGKRAFFNSKIQFDWSKYPSTSLGANATPIADNTTDYWSKTIGNRYYTPCENRLVTLLHQRHPLWANEPLGNTGTTWLYGCGSFCIIHIHSALTGKKYATPFEFETELEGKTAKDGTPLLNLYGNTTENTVKIYEGLGYNTTAYTGVLDEAAFQDILDSLANGAYIHISQSTTSNVNSGHATIGYGINELGEIMFANSDIKTDKVGVYNDGFTYEMPLQNITGPDSDIVIVKKA